jgi:hypothetical protein
MIIDTWIVIVFWIAFVTACYFLVIVTTNYSTLSKALEEYDLEDELTAEEDGE